MMMTMVSMIRQKLSIFISLLLIINAASAARTPARVKAEFIRAMNSAISSDRSDFKLSLRNPVEGNKHERQRLAKARLHERLLSKAIPVPVEDQQVQKSDKPEFMNVDTRRRLDGGNDDGGNDDADDDEVDWGVFGFDVMDYSVKYMGCSAVQMYSDEMAQNGDAETVLQTKRFVIFRFCLTSGCGKSYGCYSDYGEYMLEMEDYFEAMQEYKELEFERFCEYCEQCMYLEYLYEKYRNKNGGGDDDASDDGGRKLDGAQDDDGDDDVVMDDALVDDGVEVDDDGHICPYYDVCTEYAEDCGQVEEEEGDDAGQADDDAEEEEEMMYEEFFGCQEYEIGDDDAQYAVFIGPHCSSDRKTIVFGIFEDEFCSAYSSSSDIDEITGFEWDQSELETYYDDTCIACRESDLPYQVVEDEEKEEEEEEINELCERLYEAAAKCNSHVQTDTSLYYANFQEELEENVCAYIESVLSGSYDEDGQIYIDASDSNSGSNKANTVYNAITQEVSIGQIFGLMIAIAGCVVVAVWACFLHRALTRKAPWTPRRATGPVMSGQISRQNSGIVLGRSRSGGSYHGGTMA